MEKYPSNCLPLHQPSLKEVASVLQNGLVDDFDEISVSVVQCPDLRQKPFNLAAKGLCVSPCLADVGGEPYMLPTAKPHKVYDLCSVGQQTGMSSGLIVGAAAGPGDVLSNNSEMIANLKLGDEMLNLSHAAYYEKPEADSYEVTQLDSTQFRILGNLYLSEGKAGEVIKIEAKRKKGIPSDSNNFIRCLRNALTSHYGCDGDSAIVGLGGVFTLLKGSVNIHVMPCFPPASGVRCVDDVLAWLRFHKASAPFTSVGYLVTKDNGYGLRLEHFHGYNDRGEGGHYHYTVTPDDAEYIGYFNVPRELYRVDQPTRTDNFKDDD